MSVSDARTAASIFDPQRLRVARQLRKLTRSALADQIGVSPAAVGQWESADVRPKPETLLEIARALEFPVAYFATTGKTASNLDTECTFFRSLRRSKQIDREAAMAHAALIAELVSVIERHARLPELSIPQHPVGLDATDQDIDKVAAQVRGDWGLGDEPIDDIVRELERHGAVVARLRLTEDGIDAFSWPGFDRPIIILGVDKDDRARSRFDAAHELGHVVMHRDHPRPADRDLERQAHRFATAFLLPSHQLRSEWQTGRVNWLELMSLKRRWQISLAALLYRAQQDELLTPTTYESAVKYTSRAGWRKREPGDLGQPERPRLLHSAVDALQQAGISREDLADEAHIPLALIDEYVTMPGSSERVSVDI